MNKRRIVMLATRTFYVLDAAHDDLRRCIMELNHERAAQLNSPASGTREQAETADRLRAVQAARHDILEAMQIMARLMRLPGSLPGGEGDE